MLNLGCEPTHTQYQCLLDFEFRFKPRPDVVETSGNQHLKNFHFVTEFKHRLDIGSNIV